MAVSNLAQTRKFHPRLSMMSQYQSEEAKHWEPDEIEEYLYAAGWMQDELKGRASLPFVFIFPRADSM